MIISRRKRAGRKGKKKRGRDEGGKGEVKGGGSGKKDEGEGGNESENETAGVETVSPASNLIERVELATERKLV